MVHFYNSYSQKAILCNGMIYFVVTNDTPHSCLHYDIVYSREDSESVVDPTMTSLEGFRDWYRVKKSVWDYYLDMGFKPVKVCLCCMVDQEKRYYQEIPIVSSSDIPPLVKPKSPSIPSASTVPEATASASDDDDPMWIKIFGVVYLVISICIFVFYAHEKFGVIPGSLYSVFWSYTIPIHLLFF
jgi:hypothetical protein